MLQAGRRSHCELLVRRRFGRVPGHRPVRRQQAWCRRTNQGHRAGLRDDRVRINAICPGVIDTEMIHRFTHEDPNAEAQMADMAPVQRMGRPEEIADAVVWLLSDASSFVTGQAIAADGGFVTR